MNDNPEITPEMAKAGAAILVSWENEEQDTELDSFGLLESLYHSLARLVFQTMMQIKNRAI